MNKRHLKIIGLMLAIVFLFASCGDDKGNTEKLDSSSKDKVQKEDSMENSDDESLENEEDDNLDSPIDIEDEELPDKEDEELTNPEDEEIIEIREKVFIQQINDIYFSYEDYEGKKIVLEGMFEYFESYDGEEVEPVVYRNGPGCCGNDAVVYFILEYDGVFPSPNDWIRVLGKPYIRNTRYGDLLCLKVEKLEIKSERGLENVVH